MVTDRPRGYSLGRTTDGSGGYPIGYWLKRLDRAIDAALASTLATEGLARRHWQVMNVLHEGTSDAPTLVEVLAPFWDQGAIALDEVLNDLERRGLVVNDGKLYLLTAAGKATRATIAEEVDVTRGRLVDGIAREEYLATVQVLRRMATNLEGATAG